MALNRLENHKGKKKHTTYVIVISKVIQCLMPMVLFRALVTCSCEAYQGIYVSSLYFR